VLETKSIMGESAKIIAEHLLIQIPKQMERLHADIGAFQLALKQTPEVFESVSVNLPVKFAARAFCDCPRQQRELHHHAPESP